MGGLLQNYGSYWLEIQRYSFAFSKQKMMSNLILMRIFKLQFTLHYFHFYSISPPFFSLFNINKKSVLFINLCEVSQYNKNIIKKMSKCHFPQDNYTIILDMPSISHINNTLRLIETNNHICTSSLLSFSCFDKPINQQPTHQLLRDDDDQDSLGISIMLEVGRESEEDPANRKKKAGCSCKKTNCLKMYCQCFSVGKMCTPECVCYGCCNDHDHEPILSKAKQQLKGRSLINRHNNRGCNCKKTNCQKKYCECFNAGLACTSACNCCECCNKQSHQNINQSVSNGLQNDEQSSLQ